MRNDKWVSSFGICHFAFEDGPVVEWEDVSMTGRKEAVRFRPGLLWSSAIRSYESLP